MQRVGVMGSGSFGTAISTLASQNTDVLIFSRNVERVDEVNLDHILNGIEIPHNIRATHDPKHFCKACSLIFPVIPSAHMRVAMQRIAPFLRPTHIIIHATKGLDIFPPDEGYKSLNPSNVFTVSEVIEEETTVVRIGCLSGPNLAKEILEGQPTATVIASEFEEVIELGKSILASNRFYVFGSKDIRGAEIAGALKNIIALGAGILEGQGLGKNMQGMLITRGLNEMIHLGKAMGAGYVPFLGTAGIGDLVTTASSTKSRNFSFGKLLGQGLSLEEVKEKQDELAEGVRTLAIARQLIINYNLQLPIITLLHDIVYKKRDLLSSLEHLMKFPFGNDVDFID